MRCSRSAHAFAATCLSGSIAMAAGTWNEEALLLAFDGVGADDFGYTVAVDRATAVVGAWADDGPWGTSTGSAYVFLDDGTAWTFQQKLEPNDPGHLDRFGWSVAIQGETIVVGALKGDANTKADTGCAYVFVRAGTVWTQQAKLLAADGTWDDELGNSVTVQDDTAVVGAPRDDDGGGASGSAYVFTRNGTVWSEQAKLTASDASADDRFGVAVSLDAETAVIGAHYDDAPQSNSGSAYVFVRSGTTWSEQQKLTASDAPTTAYLGYALSLDGDRVAVGAWGDDTQGNTTGAVYVYERSGTTWSEDAKITKAGLADYDSFGRAVGLDGAIVAIGTPYEDVAGDDAAGTVYIFSTDGTSWSEVQRIVASNSAPDDLFGRSVSLDGTTLVTGAPGHDGLVADTGAAFVHEEGPPWTTYCTAGTSAIGCQARLSAFGTPSASATAGFVVSAMNVQPQKNGLFYYSLFGAKLPPSPWGNTSSWQCVLPPVFRTPLLFSGGSTGCGGQFDRDFAAYWATANPAKVPVAGQQVWMQCWYRDPANPGGTTSTSDALTFTLSP